MFPEEKDRLGMIGGPAGARLGRFGRRTKQLRAVALAGAVLEMAGEQGCSGLARGSTEVGRRSSSNDGTRGGGRDERIWARGGVLRRGGAQAKLEQATRGGREGGARLAGASDPRRGSRRGVPCSRWLTGKMARGQGGCARGRRRGERQRKETRPNTPSRARARRGPWAEDLGLLLDLGSDDGGW